MEKLIILQIFANTNNKAAAIVDHNSSLSNHKYIVIDLLQSEELLLNIQNIQNKNGNILYIKPDNKQNINEEISKIIKLQNFDKQAENNYLILNEYEILNRENTEINMLNTISEKSLKEMLNKYNLLHLCYEYINFHFNNRKNYIENINMKAYTETEKNKMQKYKKEGLELYSLKQINARDIFEKIEIIYKKLCYKYF